MNRYTIPAICISVCAAATIGTATPASAASATQPADSGSIRSVQTIGGGPVRVSSQSDSDWSAAPESAASSARFPSYRIINVQRTENVQGKLVIARCGAATDGGTCTISAGVSVGTTVGVSLGATIGTVTAGLNASATTTVTLSVGCASPTMRAGQTWLAYPIGTEYSYRVQRTHLGNKKTSEVLHAYIPHANGIVCGISG